MPLFRRSKIVSNFDLIIDCTDKLLNRWRGIQSNAIQTNIVQQCENLLLAIFGLIGFNYDLETLDDERVASNNELTRSLRNIINSIMPILCLPRIMAKIYVNVDYRQRRTRAVVERYIDKIIEHEQTINSELIAQPKQTSLIASLVASLQRNEEEKKGIRQHSMMPLVSFFSLCQQDYHEAKLWMKWWLF